jgi:hypothetical protein
VPFAGHRLAATAWFVGFLLLALIAVLVYRAWPMLFPPVTAAAPLDSDCDLRAGPCTGRLPGGGSVRFRIEPESIPVLRPLILTVQLDGIDAHGVEVDFAGTDMNMGYNRVSLTKETPSGWRGEGMLPICVRQVMRWEATVLLDTEQGLMAAPFRFDTYRSRRVDGG